jgi:hypothetical protein
LLGPTAHAITQKGGSHITATKKALMEASIEGVMRGKRGLIMGVANNRSLAWGIAATVRAAGAELALTYQGDAFKKRVEPLAAELQAHVVGHCDVTDPKTVDAPRSFRKSRRCGVGSTFSSTPSPSPTSRSSTAATSTRPRRTSKRRC